MNIGNSATTGGDIHHRDGDGSGNIAEMAVDMVMAAGAVTRVALFTLLKFGVEVDCQEAEQRSQE